jgi:hypothetical protein
MPFIVLALVGAAFYVDSQNKVEAKKVARKTWPKPRLVWVRKD